VSELAHVDATWHDEVPVARIAGEVDASNAAQIAARLRRLLTNQLVTLVVDLSGTTYLDSTGINLLFSLGGELRGRQQTLRLVVAPGSPIARMVSITSLDTAQPTYPTVAAALAAG
jgi:anti-anti-sigma factor